MNRILACRIAVIFGITPAILPTSSRAASFESLGPDGGRIDGFAQATSDPDRLYCHPYRQGVFRSDDHGASWQRVDNGIALDTELQRIAVSPADKNLLLVGDPANDCLLRSTDGGVTWLPVAIAADWSLLSAIAFDPHEPNAVLAAIGDGAQSGLRRSTDAGVTWTFSNSGMTSIARVIAFHPGLPGIVLAGAGAGVFRSTNGGGAWSQVTAGSTVSLSCAGASPVVWALIGNQVKRSDDNGLTFAPVAQPPGTWENSLSAITASPTDPNLVLVGQLYSNCKGDCFTSISAIYRSTNGGGTWEAASYELSGETWTDEQFCTMAFDAGQPTTVWAAITNRYSAVVKNGLVRSTNSGASFSSWMNGIHGQAILAVDRDDAGSVYARRDGRFGLWVAAGAGDSWIERVTSDVPGVNLFEANRRTPGFLLEAGMDVAACAASTNGGQAWQWMVVTPQWGFGNISRLIRSNHGEGGRIYFWIDEADWFLHRSDNGVSFDTITPVFPTAGAAIDPSNDLRLFAADQSTGEVKLTTDGGATWTPRAAGLPFTTPIDLFLDPSDADRLAVVYRTAGAYRSNDGGLSWSAVPATQGASPAVSADWDPMLDRFAIVTEANGVYVTKLGLVTEGLPTRNLTDVVFEPASDKVLVGTKYASVIGLDAPDPTDAPAIVDASALELAAEPNPFRREVTIRFSARSGRPVEVDVFTVDGRRVVGLYRGTATGGPLAVAWNGRDARGVEAAPGVYFVRARAGEEVVTRRLVRLDR